MTDQAREPEGDEVEIRVVGPISDYALSLFEGFDHVEEPATTTVRGYVADENELTELCHRLRDTGLELVSLRRVPGGPESSASPEPPAAGAGEDAETGG